jgi:hypothetical protein
MVPRLPGCLRSHVISITDLNPWGAGLKKACYSTTHAGRVNYRHDGAFAPLMHVPQPKLDEIRDIAFSSQVVRYRQDTVVAARAL